MATMVAWNFQTMAARAGESAQDTCANHSDHGDHSEGDSSSAIEDFFNGENFDFMSVFETAATKAANKAFKQVGQNKEVDIGDFVNLLGEGFASELKKELKPLGLNMAEEFYNNRPKTTATILIPVAIASSLLLADYIQKPNSELSASLSLSDVLADDLLRWDFDCGGQGNFYLSFDATVKGTWSNGKIEPRLNGSLEFKAGGEF